MGGRREGGVRAGGRVGAWAGGDVAWPHEAQAGIGCSLSSVYRRWISQAGTRCGHNAFRGHVSAAKGVGERGDGQEAPDWNSSKSASDMPFSLALAVGRTVGGDKARSRLLTYL